jgi:hypothetical protein
MEKIDQDSELRKIFDRYPIPEDKWPLIIRSRYLVSRLTREDLELEFAKIIHMLTHGNEIIRELREKIVELEGSNNGTVSTEN